LAHGRDEQRHTARIQPFVAACRLVIDGRRVPGFLTDLSPGGGRVRCDAQPPEASVVALEVKLGKHPVHSRLGATVKWTRSVDDAAYEVGLSFGVLTEEDRRTLEALVEEIQRRAEQLT
jgi:PilZ domain